MQDRREFLKKLAKGAAWTAPVVSTLALPERLYGINVSRFRARTHDSQGNQAAPEAPGNRPPGSDPPGSTPPWAEPPGGGGSGRSGESGGSGG